MRAPDYSSRASALGNRLYSAACTLGLFALFLPFGAPQRQVQSARDTVTREVLQPDSIVYYDVGGTASAQIRAEMNKLGPVGTDNKRYDAKTTWSVRYRLSPRTIPGGCEIRAEVSARFFYTMPRWTNLDKASASVSRRWREYYAALLVHEEGHARLARQAATTIQDAFTKLPGNVPCPTLREQHVQVYNIVLEEFRRRQKAYDEETQHGRTQGAVFP